MGAAQAIAVENDDQIQIIKVPAVVDRSVTENFEQQSTQWLLSTATLHIFDFKETASLDPSFFRMISTYRRALTKNGKFLCSLGLRTTLAEQVSSAGMNQVFSPVADLDKAKVVAGLVPSEAKPAKFDFTVLAPFVEGTVSALQIQANLPVSAGKPFLKTGLLEGVEIAGVISLNNPSMPGTIAIAFPKAVFLGVYESMVGEKHTEINDEIQDAASELLNIIYGHAKTKLAEKGIKVEMAIPVVLAGDKLRVKVGDPGKSMILPFQCKFGSFHIEIYFKKLIS
ncbi:MAG: chemotaxis protein CheX [Bdellovibrionales bacterium]